MHRRLRSSRYLHDRSDCYRLERQLPGGPISHREIAPFHGAHTVELGDYRLGMPPSQSGRTETNSPLRTGRCAELNNARFGGVRQRIMMTPSRRSRMTASGRARQVTFVVCGNRLERRVDCASFRRSCAANRPNKAIRLADMTYVETLGTLVP